MTQQRDALNEARLRMSAATQNLRYARAGRLPMDMAADAGITLLMEAEVWMDKAQ